MRHAPVRGFSSFLLLAIVAIAGFGAYVAYKGDINSLTAAVTSSFGTRPGTAATTTISVLSPNGGERLVMGTPATIKWSMKGVTNPIKIALMKNGTFYAWVDEAVSVDKSVTNTYSYSWTPSTKIAAGTDYKIYIKGSQAGGSSVAGDMSDSSFKIATAPQPVCGLYRGGTSQAKNMIASPNPQSSVADTDAACIAYCDASGPKPEDICMRGTNKIKVYTKDPVGLPDLTASGVSAPNAAMGQRSAISAIVSNIGKATAAATSYTSFQTALDSQGTRAQLIGYGEVNKLPAGGTAGPTFYYTFPSGTSPTQYLRACADARPDMIGLIKESNEKNNCGPWTGVTLTGGGTSLLVEPNDTRTELNNTGSSPTSAYGIFTVKFDVTAIDGDAYLPKTVDTSGASAGVVMKLAKNASTTEAISKTLTTTADSVNASYFVIHEGDTETFTVTMVINPNGIASSNGSYSVGLDKVRFSTTSANLTSLKTVEVDETSLDFNTGYMVIPG